ncbi:MAG: Nif3-like dinuclear metal center hexameric protein [Bacteroidia bacterium]
MKVSQLLQLLDAWAPFRLAHGYDNVGLLVGDPDKYLMRILTALDLTEAVLQEAVEKKADCILTHHPIWFGSKTHLHGHLYPDALIMEAIRRDIVVCAMHTNLDSISSGVNAKLAWRLGAHIEGFLVAQSSDHGDGLVVSFSVPLMPKDMLVHIRHSLSVPYLRYSAGPHRPLRQGAICGGAGSSLLPHAIQQNLDFFITADIPYHRFFEATGKIWLIDAGHYETECATAELMAEYLRHYGLSAFPSEKSTNPIQYFV